MNRIILALSAFIAAPALAAAPVFSTHSVTRPENAGTFMLPVCKDAKAKSYSKIRVQSVDGSAKAGVDFKGFDTAYTVANNTLCVQHPITIIDNKMFQPDRVFGVRIVPVRNATTVFSYQPTTVTITEDDLPPIVPAPHQEPAPTPSPAPSPAPSPTPVPGNGLAGEQTIADNFDLAGWLEPGETYGIGGSPGAFRFTCLAGQISRDDPIVYPGQPGKSHLHQFFGNTATDASSTYQSLRTSGGSTCTRSEGTSPQRSAYWMPAMLDGAGNVVKPDWMNTYYKQLPASDPECARTVVSLTDRSAGPSIGKCVPIPNGIRFILGYNMATMSGGPADLSSRDSEAMGFDCVSKASVGGASYTGLKRTMAAMVADGRCPVGEWLRVYLAFPQCWDGKNIDTPDHRAHIVMPPQSICPASHPYKVPEIAISAFFTTDANFAAGKWRLSSDEAMQQSMGAPVIAGTTLHMDYWEAWSPTIKDLWQRNCIDGPMSCSNGNVGDGRKVRGMGQIGPFPNHVLVPLSSIP